MVPIANAQVLTKQPEGTVQSRRGLWRRHWPWILLSVVALATFGAVGWHKWIEPAYFPRNFGVVREGAIYRSGQHSPRVLRQLCEQYHFKTILDLGGAVGYDARTQAQRDVAAEFGIERHEFLQPSDGTGDPDRYVQALLLMTDPARQPVLVHCGSGAQRTSTATLLYRIIVEGQSVTEAYPESFPYGHKADQWVLLAYLADNLEHIRTEYNRQNTARVLTGTGRADAPQ